MTTQTQKFYNRQIWQLAGFVVLIALVATLADWSRLASVSVWGVSAAVWFVLSLALAPAHQFYVWYVWRSELYYERIGDLFGGQGFEAYMVGFGVFFVTRISTIFLVGLADAGSLALHPVVTWGVGTVLFVVSMYALYSVVRYFGVRRASGADHFIEEYRHRPFVERGIFRYTNNGMYIYALLGLWVVGLWAQSYGALLLAFYFHTAIWLHYYCTEKPDIVEIYGGPAE